MHSQQKSLSKKNSHPNNQNACMISSQQNPINLSQTDIITLDVSKQSNVEPYMIVLSAQISLLQKQNLTLNKKNKQLITQLQRFSLKLDQQLKKRSQNQSQLRKNKPSSLLKQQQRQSIQVQNLYKKLQIYKKQLHFMKSKLMSSQNNETKFSQNENKLNANIKQNQLLKQQIKTLKKVIKQQQKGLVEVGAQGYLKMKQQNEKAKEEVKKVRLEIDQVERKYRTQSSVHPPINGANTPTSSLQNAQVPFCKVQQKNSQKSGNMKVKQTKRKILPQFRIKTQPDSNNKVSRKDENQSQLNYNRSHDKAQKLELKIRSINLEKQRQRQIIQNLKIQIIQKDKEINYLNQKLGRLRGTPKMTYPKLTKQNPSRISQVLDQSFSNTQTDEIPTRSSKMSNFNYKKKSIVKTQQQQQGSVGTDQRIRYPRLQQAESSLFFEQNAKNLHKWNHHQFSSKIKQIRVFYSSQNLNTNSTNIIRGIHLRYEKGQPHQNLVYQNSMKSAVLICSKSEDQFVQFIKGGFNNKGYLQYLILKTNTKRVVELGEADEDTKFCQNFGFNIKSDEYPSAMFGQNDQKGVKRIGCFIQKLKK